MTNNIEFFLSLNSVLAQFPPVLWMFLSFLGTGWVIFSLLFSSIIFNPRLFYAVVLTTLIAGGFSRFMKVLFAAPRPPATLEPGSFHLLGSALHAHAMPSGHTITAFAAAALIVAMRPPAQRLKYSALFLLAAGVGLSRIAIGVHWVEDVAVGSIVGTISGLFGAHLAKRMPTRTLELTGWWLKSLSFIGLICVYVLITQKIDFEENRVFQWILSVLVGSTFFGFWYRALYAHREGQS